MTCFWSVVAILVLIIIGSYIALFYARRAYLESLEKLKRHPHDPDLREATLALGRRYANMTRNMKSGTLFDEMALMNDINAACARAGSRVTIEADRRTPSLEERLSKLEDLRSKRLISEQEYQSRRQQILSEL